GGQCPPYIGGAGLWACWNDAARDGRATKKPKNNDQEQQAFNWFPSSCLGTHFLPSSCLAKVCRSFYISSWIKKSIQAELGLQFAYPSRSLGTRI
ncbi:MAG: hypothetical protein ACOC8G_02645, partial [Thermodesulfobacteriota bacterium]